jgi:cytochrome c-type biogenesis protein CcmF
MLLLYLRRSELQNSSAISSWTAKESSFMLNNLMFIALALGVFIGTILPAISEAINGEKMTVGPPFFNRIATPTGLAIYTLIGVCSLVAWGKTGWRRLGRRSVIPAGIALAVTILLIFSGVGGTLPLLALAVASFGLSAVLLEFVRSIAGRRKAPGSSIGSFFSLNKRRYGAITVHVGSILFLIGIIGSSAFNQSRTTTVQKGDTVTLGGYDLRFEALTREHRKDRHIDAIHFTISRDGKAKGTISSERHFYANFQPATEVGIRSSLIQDLYLILADYDKDAGRATVSLLTNPLMLWMWIGGVIMTLGTVIAILPESNRSR